MRHNWGSLGGFYLSKSRSALDNEGKQNADDKQYEEDDATGDKRQSPGIGEGDDDGGYNGR